MAPKKNYNNEQMVKALKDVERGVPVATAAKLYGVPRTTLLYKSTGKSPKTCTMGPPSVLTPEEEHILVQWVLMLSERHFPVTKHQLMDSVEKLIIQTKRQNPFKNNRPGDKWFKAFLKRHPEITQRVSQNLTTARENVTEQQIRSWFSEIKSYLISKNFLEIADCPNRVFNADESAFYLEPKGDKVLARKGQKSVYRTGNDEKECITVLVTANAAGMLAPPMILFSYVRVPGYISNNIPESWGIGTSENGWMCGATFYEYMTNIFEPWLTEQNIPRPILFFVDGHVSHLTLHLSNFCVEKQIELISLFPNSTHLLQPMDVSVFRPLKNMWKLEVQQWRLDNSGHKLQKQYFGKVFEAALKRVSIDTIVNGFRVSGLCPFNETNVQFSKISTKAQPIQNIREYTAININNLISGLEERIGKERKSSFEICFSSGNIWKGPIEDTALYEIWKSIKLEITDKHRHEEKNTEETVTLEPLHRTPPLEQNNETALLHRTPIDNAVCVEVNLGLNNKENEQPVVDGATTSNQTKLPLNVPTPFKKALFWPDETPSTKKRRIKEKIPSVITSDAWRRYHMKKEDEKRKKNEEKQMRARLREQKKLDQQKRKSVIESESSEEEWVESGDSLDDVDLFGETDANEFCETLESSDISIGDFLLVKFLGGKRKTVTYRYVCVVQNISDHINDIEVMSMKALNDEKTMFRACGDDISSISKTEILGKLPSPCIIASGDRLKYQFQKTVNVYEAS